MIGIILVAMLPLIFLRGTDPTVAEIVRTFYPGSHRAPAADR